jgi:hypothetical protein
MSLQDDLSQNIVETILQHDNDAFFLIVLSGLVDEETWKLVLLTLNPALIAINRKDQILLDFLCNTTEIPIEIFHTEGGEENNILIQVFKAGLDISIIMTMSSLYNPETIYHLLIIMKEQYKNNPQYVTDFLKKYYPINNLANQPSILHYIYYLYPEYGFEALKHNPNGLLKYQNIFQSEIINIQSVKTSEIHFRQIIELYIKNKIELKYPASVIRQIIRDKNLELLIDIIQHNLIKSIDVMHNYTYGGFYDGKLLYFFRNLNNPKQSIFFKLIKNGNIIQKDKITLTNIERINEIDVLINLLWCINLNDISLFFPEQTALKILNHMTKQGLKFTQKHLKQLRQYQPFTFLLPEKIYSGIVDQHTDLKLLSILNQQYFYLVNSFLTDDKILINRKFAKTHFFSHWDVSKLAECFNRKIFAKKLILCYYHSKFGSGEETKYGLQKLINISIDPSNLPYLYKGINKKEDFLLKLQNGHPWLLCNRITLRCFEKIIYSKKFPIEYLTSKIYDKTLIYNLIINEQGLKLQLIFKHPQFDLEKVDYIDLINALNSSTLGSNNIIDLIKQYGLFDKIVSHHKIWEKMLDELLNNGTKVNKFFFDDWLVEIEKYLKDYGSNEICDICCSHRKTLKTRCGHSMCHYCPNQVNYKRCPYCRGHIAPLSLIKIESNNTNTNDVFISNLQLQLPWDENQGN